MLNVVIGRNPESDFRLLNGSVSRLHAVLKISDADKLTINDSGSHNGTYLLVGDGWKKVSAAEIKRDDRLRFGEAEVDVLDILGALARRTKLGGGRKLKPGEYATSEPPEKALARFKKPRRNKITGDIEEGG